MFDAVVARENLDGTWSAALCRYKNRRQYERSEGDCNHEVLKTCGHRHQRPDNKPISKCCSALAQEYREKIFKGTVNHARPSS